MADKSFKYIIVEDSYFQSLSLRIALAQLRPCMTLAGVADDIQGALGLLRYGDVDLVFTKQSVCDGNVTEDFKRLGIKVPLIVISESNDFIGDEGINVIDSVIEPLTHDSLLRALERFEHMHRKSFQTTNQ